MKLALDGSRAKIPESDGLQKVRKQVVVLRRCRAFQLAIEIDVANGG
jgi:hypothetical protein